MSDYYAQTGKYFFPKYERPGRTKQAFKKSCDINAILKKAQKTGTVSHLAKHGGEYGDFTGFDFLEAQTRLAKAAEIFDELPSEMRKEFDNQPAKFFEFANDPQNVGKLAELLPEIAKPGNYFPSPTRTAATEAVRAVKTAESTKDVQPPPEAVKTTPEASKTE